MIIELDHNRFLSGHVDIPGGDFQVIPFGAGRRICVRMSMGFHIIHHMLASRYHTLILRLVSSRWPVTREVW